MVSLDDAVILRLEKNKERFEIFADPAKVVEYRKGAVIALNDVLAAFQVFKDGRKGDTQSDEILRKNFGTTAFEPIAREILMNGELHLTTEQKRKLLDEKRAKLMQYIAQNYIDPRTNAPHPLKRIELAMEEAKVHVDPSRSVEAQMEDVLKKLRPIIPLKFEIVHIAIKVPAAHAHHAYGIIKEFSPKKEEWLNDGSLVALVEIPPGMQAILFDRLNKATHGEVQTKILDK